MHYGDNERPTQVAQYVRMSTDHQRYSTENQRDTISKYAAQHGMAIVRTYADEGKSGLSLEGRNALKQLIDDVESGAPGFGGILVYDISRWGRFQDADESACYEYLCKRAGIQVFNCAEPFENDGSPMATIMKSVKRALAGEYSRELSNKVFQGVVIECKTTRADFLADAKKPHRVAIGMGRYRYFLCPDGLLSPAEMPDRWGLLVVNARGSIKALRGAVADLPRHSGLQTWPDLTKVLESWEHQNDSARETLLLTSILSRVGDVEAANIRIREADARYSNLAKRFEKQRDEVRRLRSELAIALTDRPQAASRHNEGAAALR